MTRANKYKLHLAVTSILFFVGMLFLVKAGYAQSRNDVYQTKTFDVSGPVSLEVLTSGGSIEVEGRSGNEVKVEMYVRKRGRYIDPGEADLDDYNIEISQDGNYITAKAERESSSGWWGNGYSISFIVYTPHESRSRLKTSGGSLSASNLKGTQELRTSGGSVNVASIVGDVVLDTSGGSIGIDDVHGNVDAETSGGRIEAQYVVGNVTLKTSGGSIGVEAIEGNVRARTSGGSIRASIDRPKEYINLRTSGGSIKIEVPGDLGYDLDLDGNRVKAELKNFDGESERDEIEGRVNGGGTRIEAKTSGGSVTLSYLN
ncbi:MAG: DUF4097 domain-containing protein [Balneolaceae bacterium]|nr:DUF4097 domain-containing protein [Balneolaceae bacterium]